MKHVFKKIGLILVIFFGLSIGFRSDRGRTSSFPISLKFKLLQEPLHATADDWGFVRQSATWARGNSLFMDDIIAGIQANQLLTALAHTQIVSATNIPMGDEGGVFDIKLRLKDNTSPAPFTVLSSSVFASPKDFDNCFQLKVAGTNTIALQFFWDNDPRDPNQDGAILFYNLSLLAPNKWTATAIIESYVYSPDTTDPKYDPNIILVDQGLVQTYSWAGPLGTDTLAQSVKSGRVILEEMDGGAVFCFKTVVSVNGTADFSSLSPLLPANKAFCNTGNADEYYKLAYSQELTGNLEVIAKSGWEEGGVTSVAPAADDQICSYGSINYGIFDVNGFVKDKIALVSVPSYDHINATRVSKLYQRIGTTGKSGSGDLQGVKWDDLTQATIQGLTSSVTFKDLSGYGF
ncbi:hypothetical protein EHO58_18085 [Leptospira selangorensis]|uniref:LIC_12337 family protein n=1 Tax=Leptospira selangorensis TaxID=2484982 RepID=UPI0010835D08|nr:hypothetical protein [Leptospira selangorensis]TGK00375.1 hypothetical protein EHO58_18085 [Leptospira selangorensis]